MQSRTNDRYNRWQGLAISQLSVAVALLSGLSVSGLGVGILFLRDKSFMQAQTQVLRVVFALSIVLLLLAVFLTAFAVVSRTLDFRLTARKARKERNQKYDRPLTIFWLNSEAYGRSTWGFFWSGFISLIFGTLLLVVSIAASAALPASGATVAPGVPHECAIRLTGPIDANTPAALEAAIKKVKAGPCWRITEEQQRTLYSKVTITPATLPVWRRISLQIVDSPGGDLIAATEAGRIIRRELLSTIIPANGVCASACVFVYLGGVERTRAIGGRIGLHRPYSMRGSQSFPESQEQIKRMTALAKTYLEEMSIPVRLMDVMNAVPPDQIRWLPDTEQDADLMTELLIEGEDPAFADLRDSELARLYGLTKAEYYERQNRAKVVCNDIRLKEIEDMAKAMAEGKLPSPGAYGLCYTRIMMTGKK